MGTLIAQSDHVRALTTVISGGQTGVDQAALRAARAAGFECGGWCPPGRACESGIIPLEFPLRETPRDRSPDAPDIPRSQRTEWNVRDADATLILDPCASRDDPGVAWTIRCTSSYEKPLYRCDPTNEAEVPGVLAWLETMKVHILNIAGPSEATAPGIGEQAHTFLTHLFARLD